MFRQEWTAAKKLARLSTGAWIDPEAIIAIVPRDAGDALYERPFVTLHVRHGASFTLPPPEGKTAREFAEEIARTLKG